MGAYQYTPRPASEEIRLLKLLPEAYDDAMHIEIFHASFLPLVKNVPERDIALEKLPATLQPHWKVHRTLEGDLLFHFKDPKGSQNQTSRKHPEEGFVISEYEENLVGGEQDPQSIPDYEALSYTWGTPEDHVTAYIQPQSRDPAAGTRTLQTGQNATSASLKVNGIRISPIASLDSSEMSGLNDAIDTLRDLGVEKLQNAPYAAGGTPFEASAWAICSGQLQDRFAHASVFPMYSSWKASILNRLSNEVVEKETKKPYFWHWVQNYIIGRRIVSTESGLVGMVMGEAHKGSSSVNGHILKSSHNSRQQLLTSSHVF